MTPRAAYRALGLEIGAAASAIRIAYLDGARALHPDRGGDSIKFAALAEAYRVATEHARNARIDCPTCRGEGKVWRGRGFAKQSLQCGACRGSGRV